MKLNKIISIILLFLLVSMTAFGQSRTIRRGNTFFERGEYFKALEYYTEAQSDGEELSIEVRSRIAQCQYHLKDIDAAFNLFREIEDQLEGQDLFIYASTTHAFGYYEGAIELYRQCLEQGIGNASQIQELIKSCEWAIENRDIRIDFLVNPSELLTFGQSFGIQYYKDGVVYSSSSGEGNEVDRYGKEFLNLYYSRLEDGEIQEQRLFSENIVYDNHVGAISFTSDEETMYYTKSVRVRGGDSRIKIFRVTYDGNEWGNEEELSINSDNYDCAYPAVTPDDKYLIFASNMKGGFGGTDLYIAERFGNGRFGSPKNLGPNINSFGYERFPFVSDQYDLYFASDGHMGFGGLDIFKATSLGEGEWGDVENMMQFINSSKDDFGYVIDPDNPKRGFLSSNRLGSGQEDVIFYVEPLSSKEDTSVEGEEEGAKEDDSMLMGGLIFNNQPKSEDADEPEPEPEPEVDVSMFPDALSTTVNSTFNGTAIDGANIVVEDVATGQVVVEGTTDRNGKVHLILPDEYRKQDQSFKISINKGDDYLGKNMIVDIMEHIPMPVVINIIICRYHKMLPKKPRNI
jgi:tetratricopeptide (TPR) repeat protein